MGFPARTRIHERLPFPRPVRPEEHLQRSARSLIVPEKIRGYFHWRQTRRGRGEEQPGPSPDRPPLVFLASAPSVRLPAEVKIPRTEPLPDRYTIEVKLDESPGLSEGTACRAFLVEQAVLDRLRTRAAPAVVCREGRTLTLRDAVTWGVRASVAIAAGVASAAVVDEQRVAVLALSNEVLLWDTLSDETITVAEARENKGLWGLTAIVGGCFAWGNNAGEVTIFDPATCAKRIVSQHPAAVTALAALPDGRLAVGHRDGAVWVDGSIYVVPNGDPIGAVAAVGGRVALFASGGAVRVWTPGEKQAEALPVLANGLIGLPDGRLVTAGPSGLTLWDLEKGAWRVLSDEPARAVVAVPGPRLIKTTDDESLWSWNLRTGQDRLLQPGQAESGFMEPLAGGAMRPFLNVGGELALGQLLDHRLLSEEFAVQQAVSAMPELEGRLTGKRIVLEAAIPPDSPNISDRAWVVVVVDGSGRRPGWKA